MRGFLTSFAFVVCCASGCSSAPATNEPTGDVFIANTSDLDGFRGWEAFHLPNEQELRDAKGDIVHPAGPRTVYLKQRPPSGSTTFPIGTMIVKEIEVGDIVDRTPVAMVQRGGDFNAGGTPTWEYFELQNRADGSVARIVWRGVGPTGTADIYGGDKTVCIGCHQTASANDYVQSPPLQLSNF